jgi:zinc transport system substrate-binding protein
MMLSGSARRNARASAAVLLMLLAVQPAAAQEPAVVVTMKPIHSLALRVMDGVGQPTLLIDGKSSPHTFTLKPSQARAVQSADVFVRVSPNVEPFTRKLVGALSKSVTVLTLAEAKGVRTLPARRDAAFEAHDHGDADSDDHGHDHGHDHAHDQGKQASKAGKHGKATGHHGHDEGQAIDGHVWLDPENAVAIVDAMVAELGRKFPAHADRLRTNGEAVKSDLRQLTQQVEADLLPVKGKPFVVFHDAIQYFETRFGMPASGAITL